MRQNGRTTAWENWGHDKPDHPLLTATAQHTEQNTGKTMSKEDKGPRSKHQASPP